MDDPTPQVADHEHGGACVLCTHIRNELYGETIANDKQHVLHRAKEALRFEGKDEWAPLCVNCALFVHAWGIAHSPVASRLIVPPTNRDGSSVPIIRKN